MAVWNALAALAAVTGVGIGTWQIIRIRQENKRDRTLRMCVDYNIDPIIDASARSLRKAHQDGAFQSDPNAFRSDIATIFNYFDMIAVGVEQGLLIDNLARDHLQNIIREYEDTYFRPDIMKTMNLDVGRDWPMLKNMCNRWRVSRPLFSDKLRF